MRSPRSLVRMGTVYGLSALALAAACSAPVRPSPDPAPALRPDTVTAVDPVVRREARLLAMLDRREVDTALVDSLLSDADATRRARATLAIGQGKIRPRYPQLRALVQDGDTAIAANAAYALGLVRDTTAIGALVRAVGGAPASVAREAAWALGEMGEPARGAMVGLLGTTVRGGGINTQSVAFARPFDVRAAIMLAMARLQPYPVARVIPWLRDVDVPVVRAVAYGIARQRVKGGARAMLALRAHPDEEVRQYVARTLTKATVGDSLNADAQTVLRTLVTDSSERVRINAVRSAATFGAALASEVLARFSDPVPNVRVAAAEFAADAFGRDETRWRAAWEADTTLAVRRMLLGAMRKSALPVALGVEDEWARHPDWRYRVASLGDGEGRATEEPALTRSRLLLADSNPRVRRVATLRVEGPTRVAGDSIRREAMRRPAERPITEYDALVRRYWTPGAAPAIAYLDTEIGTVTLELFGREAPLIVESFVALAQRGQYGNGMFHRIVPNFVVQDGDVSPDGSGRSDFMLRESFSRQRHGRGCVGLATSGPDTGGSQFYLCHSAQPHLDGAYTVFGRVIAGWEVLDRLVQGHLLRAVRIE